LYDTRGEIVGAIESVRDITDRKEAEEDLIKSHERLEAIFSGTVSALAVTTEKRDQYTAGHQHRVAALACAIAREMGLPERTIDDIKIAGTLHDIGKLYVPLDILSQTGKLTDIEKLFVKTHPATGYDIIKSIPFEGPIAEIILQHHERFDGSGYPRGLKSGDILLEAKVLSVADVVEAMASHRPYRVALGIDKALEEIQVNSGILYDEQVVKACVSVIRNNKFSLNDA
jgi:putative nucleotidyltransferase with HDIG domain